MTNACKPSDLSGNFYLKTCRNQLAAAALETYELQLENPGNTTHNTHAHSFSLVIDMSLLFLNSWRLIAASCSLIFTRVLGQNSWLSPLPNKNITLQAKLTKHLKVKPAKPQAPTPCSPKVICQVYRTVVWVVQIRMVLVCYHVGAFWMLGPINQRTRLQLQHVWRLSSKRAGATWDTHHTQSHVGLVDPIFKSPRNTWLILLFQNLPKLDSMQLATVSLGSWHAFGQVNTSRTKNAPKHPKTMRKEATRIARKQFGNSHLRAHISAPLEP